MMRKWNIYCVAWNRQQKALVSTRTQKKTEFIWFKQNNAISTLNETPQKLVEQFPYLGRDISSTETNINMRIEKVWTVIDRLSSIWKSKVFDKIKRSRVSTIVWLNHLSLKEQIGGKPIWELHKDVVCCFKQTLEVAPFKISVVWQLGSYFTNHPSKTNLMLWLQREKQERTHKGCLPMGSYTRTHQCWPTSKI